MATDNYFLEVSRAHGGPAWRVRLARQLNEHRKIRRILADPWIRDYVRYRRLVDKVPSARVEAAEKYPHIAQAEAFWANAAWREILLTLVLGRVPPADIAERLGVTERVLAAVEALFFDVRDRLDMSDWIVLVVIGDCAKAREVDLVSRLRIAYFGGPIVAQALVDARVRLASAEAQQLVDRTLLLHAKLKAAIELPLIEQHVIKITKLLLDYRLADERLELDKLKFAHRCEQDLQKAEFQRQRLALRGVSRDGPAPAAEQPVVATDAPADEVRADEVRADEAPADEGRAGEGRAGEGRAGEDGSPRVIQKTGRGPKRNGFSGVDIEALTRRSETNHRAHRLASPPAAENAANNRFAWPVRRFGLVEDGDSHPVPDPASER